MDVNFRSARKTSRQRRECLLSAHPYTDEKRYFISESTAYRILGAADLITAPDYVVIKAAEEFKDKNTAINEMWETDFTYFKIIGWGWYYLNTILNDYSRYIIA